MSRSVLTLTLLLLCSLLVRCAAASEQSKRLYSRGLVDFHAGRYTEALTLFDQAVADDAGDVYARYYRAVTRARLQDVAGAISDLRAALAAKPDFDQAALELGAALVQTGAYAEAVPWLQQAQRNPDADAQASLFLGLAQLRLGQLDDARTNFQRAAKDPQQRLAARYYEGVVAYRAGERGRAEELFTQVVRDSAPSDVKREAALFLERLHEPTVQAYQVYGTGGFQYDSNVSLAPSNEVIKQSVGISRQSDGRITLGAGGTYALWQHERTQLSVGYDFFQSLHFHLTDFNLQDNGPSLSLASGAGIFQFGILGRYDYYLLSTDSFLQEGTALPWLTIMGERGRLELFYRMRRRDFKQRAFVVRDAFNHAVGARQFFYIDTPEHYVFVSYRFDHEDPMHSDQSAQQFAYDGQEVGGGVGWVFPAAVTAEASYAYHYENYAGQSLRHDDEHDVIAIARKGLTDHLALVAGYFGTINNSNNSFFNYNRHIGSLALEARF